MYLPDRKADLRDDILTLSPFPSELRKVDRFLESTYTDVMEVLTLDLLKENVALFVQDVSKRKIDKLYDTTDGKAIGTYIEHTFHDYLEQKGLSYTRGGSASGIDFPDPSLNVDMKTTRITQPQSSCPFRRQVKKCMV